MSFVRQAVLMDAIVLAPNLRQADYDELLATTYRSPLECLITPFTRSDSQIYTIVGDHEEILGMFGIGKEGAIWMLSSEGLYDNYREPFIRQCRKWIDLLQADHPVIYNFVDVRNTKAIRWLKFCGFTVDSDPQPYGHWGNPFYLLHRQSK